MIALVRSAAEFIVLHVMVLNELLSCVCTRSHAIRYVLFSQHIVISRFVSCVNANSYIDRSRLAGTVPVLSHLSGFAQFRNSTAIDLILDFLSLCMSFAMSLFAVGGYLLPVLFFRYVSMLCSISSDSSNMLVRSFCL